ncbi:WxL protein peptidoglycan domain-containing protein [Streptomyces sp. NPDC098781]|uniref:WxL protein peptidoglycan domain-containing protein n=1 Tax=Streptomyces sp. NPDC098781 TaxID=3366097 RepID=UPI0038118154
MITTSARRIAAVLAACLLAVLPATHASAGAPGDGGQGSPGRTTFGVQPSAAKKPDARPNFSYGATPGALVKDHIAVFNYGTKPLTLRVYAQDAFTTADGGFDLFAAKHKPTDAGSWIELRKDQVKIPARSRVIVPFTLTVPAKATPGDHTAGIVASLSAAGADDKGSKVALDQRVGARVYLRVAGALTPRLAVEDLRTVYDGTANPFGTGSATVTYTVRNTGNVRLAAHQTVTVRDGLGGTAEVSGPRDLPELLPGDSVAVTAKATGVLPAFRDTTSVTIDPEPVRGDIQHRILPRVTATEAFTAVPWAFLALLLVLATAVTLVLIRRHRRRRSRSAPARSVSRPKQAVGLAAATVLAAGAFVGGTPVDARAADAGRLAVTPGKGSDTQAITLTAEAPCPARTTNVIARVAGAGFPRDGQIVVGNAPLTTYGTVPGAGLSIPLMYTMRDYAGTAGFTTLRGTYTFTVSCLKGPFDPTSLRNFTGSLRFTQNSAYRDGTKVALPEKAPVPPSPAAPNASTAPEASGQSQGLPVPAATGQGGAAVPPGTAQTVPVAAAEDSDPALTAWSVTGFGVCLLALATAVALRVRGRRARSE